MRGSMLSFLLFLGVAACGGGGSKSTGDEPIPPGVDVNAPAADASVEIGQPVEVRYVDDGAGGDTDVVAVRESDGMEVSIAVNRPHVAGVEQTVSWDTGGAPAGEWRIECRSTRDGLSSTAFAAGVVTLVEPAEPSGLHDAEGRAAAAWPNGDYAEAGRYRGERIFGGGEHLPPSTQYNAYVLRYHAGGGLAWARAIRSSSEGTVTDLAALPDGSVVVVGHHSVSSAGGDVVVGADRPDAVTIPAPPSTALFPIHSTIARFGPAGEVLWATAILSANRALIHGVALADDGLVVVGECTSATVFGTGDPTETTVTEVPDTRACFIARYSLAGEFQWVRTGDYESGDVRFNEVVALSGGSVVASGAFDVEDLVLGKGEPNETTLPAGGIGVFVARYESDGDLAWARSGERLNPDVLTFNSSSLTVLADGRIVLLLWTTGGVRLGGATFLDLPQFPEPRSFLVWFDADGDPQSARPVGGEPPVHHGLAADAANLYMVGRVAETEAFGEGEANETLVGRVDGHRALFAAAYDHEGVLRRVLQPASALGDQEVGAVAAGPAGRIVVVGTCFEGVTMDTVNGLRTVTATQTLASFGFVLDAGD